MTRATYTCLDCRKRVCHGRWRSFWCVRCAFAAGVDRHCFGDRAWAQACGEALLREVQP